MKFKTKTFSYKLKIMATDFRELVAEMKEEIVAFNFIYDNHLSLPNHCNL